MLTTRIYACRGNIFRLEMGILFDGLVFQMSLKTALALISCRSVWHSCKHLLQVHCVNKFDLHRPQLSRDEILDKQRKMTMGQSLNW